MNVSNVQLEDQKKKQSPYYLNASLSKYKSYFDLNNRIGNIVLNKDQQHQEHDVNESLKRNDKD